jgi:hypothetical protein
MCITEHKYIVHSYLLSILSNKNGIHVRLILIYTCGYLLNMFLEDFNVSTGLCGYHIFLKIAFV